MLSAYQTIFRNMLFSTPVLLLVLLLLHGCKNATNMSTHKNNLGQEKSPYLLQHANNPVHWQPWGNAALTDAASSNRLVIISIGYSSCHWCHVMEHESFEDTAVARVMNELYVSIKVDREERPDVDDIYMTAAQLISGRGGWPLNVIALPDGRPVWAATYLPKERWTQVLKEVSGLYQTEPEKFEEYATNLTRGIKQSQLLPLAEGEPNFKRSALDSLFNTWQANLDTEEGGANRAPKFPMPGALAYLMHYGVVNENPSALSHVELTLTKMAFGGIYDQVGGGFARYSTDSFWKVPHFEKMLYDNAQLVSLYSQAYRQFKNPLFKETVEQTLDFLERELQHPSEAFYSALDADSEGEEGKFYVWSLEELQALIAPEDWPLFKAFYTVNPKGYWEGNYILLRQIPNSFFEDTFGLSADALRDKQTAWQKTLLTARAKRERPGLDDKALTSWNALMLTGYVEAYRSFGEAAYLAKAEAIAAWIISAQSQKDGSLYHSFKDGDSYIDGLLEDYAFAAQAFTELFALSGKEVYLHQAATWVNYAQENFKDSASGLFYTRSSRGEQLIAKGQETADNVIPSANATLARTLFKLSHYLAKPTWKEQSEKMLHQVQDRFLQYGESYYHWGGLYLYLSAPFYEIAISGPNALEKLNSLNQNYLPQSLSLAHIEKSDLPLLQERFDAERTRIFVCQEGACQLPVEEIEKALAQMAR
jgi:uncharacterized protein YyaL (SSP411 family)